MSFRPQIQLGRPLNRPCLHRPSPNIDKVSLTDLWPISHVTVHKPPSLVFELFHPANRYM